MDLPREERLAYAITEARRIHHAISTSTNDTNTQLVAARSLIRFIDSNRLMELRDSDADQVIIVDHLQQSAYHDLESNSAQDIAAWCITQWLRLLQRNSQNVSALQGEFERSARMRAALADADQGLGQAWLSRAQAALARIHRAEGSSSSSSGNGRPTTAGSMTYTSSDEARELARTTAEADARLHTADYVEARGVLLPSTEYFTAAVTLADRQGTLAGSLLALAAESYMSLGNVSYSHLNEQYFRQALLYLRRASQMPGYTLSPYLQNYLEDYGSLIE